MFGGIFLFLAALEVDLKLLISTRTFSVNKDLVFGSYWKSPVYVQDVAMNFPCESMATVIVFAELAAETAVKVTWSSVDVQEYDAFSFFDSLMGILYPKYLPAPPAREAELNRYWYA